MKPDKTNNNHFTCSQSSINFRSSQKLDTNQNPLIEVLNISPVTNRGALRAYLTVKVGDFVFSDCRIIQEDGKRAWFSFPVISFRNEQGTVKYKSLISTENQILKNEITNACVNAWEKFGGNQDGNSNE